MAYKNYKIRDNWLDIDKYNDVDIQSVDGVIQTIKVNGEDAGGGGEGIPVGLYINSNMTGPDITLYYYPNGYADPTSEQISCPLGKAVMIMCKTGSAIVTRNLESGDFESKTDGSFTPFQSGLFAKGVNVLSPGVLFFTPQSVG